MWFLIINFSSTKKTKNLKLSNFDDEIIKKNIITRNRKPNNHKC